MVSRFVRRVRTASGAVAVQLATKQAGEVLDVDHVGSAHTDDELAVLLDLALAPLRPGQDTLDLGDLGDLSARAPRMQGTTDFTAAADAGRRDCSSTIWFTGSARWVRSCFGAGCFDVSGRVVAGPDRGVCPGRAGGSGG